MWQSNILGEVCRAAEMTHKSCSPDVTFLDAVLHHNDFIVLSIKN